MYKPQSRYNHATKTFSRFLSNFGTYQLYYVNFISKISFEF
nr:MAG TPA: hypothetical protein [Caudoviricetes sp.]DAX14423.1 MAG TPA: hypothetical protein [Bacteriophage sp.]